MGGRPGHGVFVIERTADGTTLFTWSEDLVVPWWLARLGQKLAECFVLGPIWRRNLAALKLQVENG